MKTTAYLFATTLFFLLILTACSADYEVEAVQADQILEEVICLPPTDFTSDTLYLVEMLEQVHPIFILADPMPDNYEEIRDSFIAYAENYTTLQEFILASREYLAAMEDGHFIGFNDPFVPVFTMEPLPDHIIDFIYGRTFRSYAPFDLCFLTYLTITYVDFNGEYQIGHMIVADEIGEEVLEIFQEIYEARFPIYSIKLIDYFDAIDYYSLAANNSSAFNFRYIANTRTISRHGFGMAIDINPIQNPYVRGNNVKPDAGRAYLDRSYVRPGMIVRGDAVYNAFISRGWTWGGNWTLPRDYHHFERR